MLHRKMVIATLTGLGFLACGRGTPEASPPDNIPETTASTPAAEATATPAPEAVVPPVQETIEPPTGNQAAPGAAAVLVGNWELRSDPPQRMPGLHMTITVDSTSGPRYFGRLNNYFSGDVGIDPREFEPFTGSIGPGRTVTFAMPTRDDQTSGITMEGNLTADTVRLSRFVLGPDTLSNAARRWMLVKVR